MCDAYFQFEIDFFYFVRMLFSFFVIALQHDYRYEPQKFKRKLVDKIFIYSLEFHKLCIIPTTTKNQKTKKNTDRNYNREFQMQGVSNGNFINILYEYNIIIITIWMDNIFIINLLMFSLRFCLYKIARL